MRIIHWTWQNAKLWRTISLGPVSIIFRMGRTVPVSSNARRRLLRPLQNSLLLLRDNRDRRFIPAAILPIEQEFTRTQAPDRGETALVVGVGPGLGFALARKLAASGMRVALASRRRTA